jgi:hypothetical protein
MKKAITAKTAAQGARVVLMITVPKPSTSWLKTASANCSGATIAPLRSMPLRSKPAAKVLPALKPYQPIHSIKTPRAERGTLWDALLTDEPAKRKASTCPLP